MYIYDVKINGIENPIGFRYDYLSCSWKVSGTEGKRQQYAEIKVGKTRNIQNPIYKKQGADLDSTGEFLKIKLEPYTRYYFQIQVVTDLGESILSEICYFETGKETDSWSGKWIGMQQGDAFHPIFKKSFSVSKKVEKARLYICGLGVFEAYLNENKIGNEYLAPFLNDYKENFQYCTYDITSFLKQKNEFSVLLGNGWYKGRYGLPENPIHFGDDFLVIAELYIIYEDGTTEKIVTDDSWKYVQSFIYDSSIYDGEVQNYLLLDTTSEKRAVEKKVPVPLKERLSLQLGVREEITVKEVIQTPKGEFVLDLGQEFSGYLECALQIPRGQTIEFDYGEILQDGNFYNENLRTAKAHFSYKSDGKYRIIRPHFTYYGFRYVRVKGLDNIRKEDFIGKVVYSNIERTGYIETSDIKLNRLYENTVWGLKSNFLDLPTDCPQRDERLGWTGDAQVFAPTASYHMDTRAFYHKYLMDLRSDQKRHHGRVPYYIPNPDMEAASSVWGDAATFIPQTLYLYYGNKKRYKEYYPLMKEWVDFIIEQEAIHHHGKRTWMYDFDFQWGDWLALDGVTEQSVFGATDTTYVSTMYFYASTGYVAQAAEILGYKEDAKKYSLTAEKIKDAILHEYFSPSGRLTIDTQTGYFLALRFHVYRNKEQILNGLKKRLQKDCYRIKGGFVGATTMCSVLAENGLEELAYDFLFFEKFPGWMFAVNQGATTIWERWNSVLEDGHISGTGMNSLNHYAYGSVVEFLYRYTAGIKPVAPGFKKVELCPKPTSRLRYFKASYDSVSGKYVVNWNIKKDGNLHIHIEIPFGTSAIVTLPSSGKDAFILESGNYDYEYQPQKDYNKKYNLQTRLEQLADDEEAMKIVKKHEPVLYNIIQDGNIEFNANAIGSLEPLYYMGINPESTDTMIQDLLELHY